MAFIRTVCLVLLGQVIVIVVVLANQRHNKQCTLFQIKLKFRANPYGIEKSLQNLATGDYNGFYRIG